MNTNSTNRKKILIIDDDDLVRHLLIRTLNHNYDIIEAESIDQGFQLTLEQNPDLIITDHNTPGTMCGLDLVKKIRKIPIILLSGTDDIPEQARSLGARFAFLKPIETSDLIAAVTSIFSN